MLAISIAAVLGSDVFKTIGIPLLSCVICVVAKIVSRNKKHKGNNWNEWAIGLELIFTAIILMIMRSIDHFVQMNQAAIDHLSRQHLNEQVVVFIWMPGLLMFALFMISLTIPEYGWKNKEQMNVFWVWGCLM